MNGKTINLSNQRNIGNYLGTRDATVPNGIEIVAPIIHDNPEELSKFAAVLETIRSFGMMDFQRQYISTLEKQYGYLEISDDREQEYSDIERD